MSAINRTFLIQPRHLAGHHARMVNGSSFEAAAVAYVEIEAPAFETDSAVSLLVRELDSGLEHCIRIDLETGQTEPCV